MNEPQHTNQQLLRNTVSQLNFEALSADMVQIRCEVMIQQNIWYQQQLQLKQDNQLLLLSLQQMVIQHTDAQAQLEQLTQDCQCDALTQTLNRRIMLDRIAQSISLAKRQNSQIALLFIDLDNFKPINDQFGHATGDAVLQQVSKRMNSVIRESDAISRHGGDEFLLLLNNIHSRQDAKTFAIKLLKIMCEPYEIDGRSLLLSASTGIALFPQHGDSASSLIGYADAAMYRAKQRGGCRVC
jgi:diguanylate cyclase